MATLKSQQQIGINVENDRIKETDVRGELNRRKNGRKGGREAGKVKRKEV